MAALDLTPAAVDVTYKRGDGRTITLTYPETVDLTSPARTYTAQIRASVASTVVLGTLEADLTDAHTVVLTPDDDAIALDPGSYLYDVQYTIAGGRPVTVMAGRWRQIGDVTR